MLLLLLFLLLKYLFVFLAVNEQIHFFVYLLCIYKHICMYIFKKICYVYILNDMNINIHMHVCVLTYA